jgi:hypothetical protein
MRIQDASVVEGMLASFSGFTEKLGGLEFYGNSPDFRKIFNICRCVVEGSETPNAASSKAYLFLGKYHGKTSIAKAVEREAQSKGLSTRLLDGKEGATQKTLMELVSDRNVVTILDGLPEASASRRTVLERFNRLEGRGVLLALPEYAADATLDDRTPTLLLSQIDQRPMDKLAWLIGLIREGLFDEAGRIPDALSRELGRIPGKAMLTLVGSHFGERITRISSLGRSIAEALRLRAGLESETPLPQEDLAEMFMQFYADRDADSAQGFRLWVEGETDSRLFALVAKLAKLEGGLAVLPLGLDREGGTAKAIEIVIKERTRRNKDIFLFDSDQPGRHAKEELGVIGQEAILLDPKVSCSRVEPEVEIEDFVSLACLDRFYEEHTQLRPEKEMIRYKSPEGRRLIVDGADKGTLLTWLESSASLPDLENLLWILCDIRSKFSLKQLYSLKELQERKRQLETETNAKKHLGNRPKHWAVVEFGAKVTLPQEEL